VTILGGQAWCRLGRLDGLQHPSSIQFRRSWMDSWLKDELVKSVEGFSG